MIRIHKKIWAKVLLLIMILPLSAQDQGALDFRNVGPARGGRVTAVCGVNTQPNVFYMGATGGGIWKSEDYGQNWKNISDGYFKSPSIGSIAVHQRDPNILFVGTGSDAIRSNVIVGKGVYKSTDAGESWEHMGLAEAGQIGSVLIHPDNSEIVYVAVIGQPFRKSTRRGVYKTIDGGTNWSQVLFLSDSVGAVDLEFAPNDPDIVYAAMWRAMRKPWTIVSGGSSDGIYKSLNGGTDWEKLAVGLPDKLIGKIDLAVSKDKPSRVWAQIQASDGQEGIYRSDNFGRNWQKVDLPERTHQSIMYRPFYFTNINANPQNADNIWAGTKQFWTSYDGGAKWKTIPAAHADHHDLWINPFDTLIMIAGNDGGASVSRDGGHTWSHQFNQPTAELYSCYADDQYPYYLYSGQQDNSTIRIPSRAFRRDVLSSNDHHALSELPRWERVGGCETGPAIPKPGDPDIVYANCKGQFTVYDHRTGVEKNYYIGGESLYGNHPDDITYRFQRVTPMEVSPHDANTIYYGSQYVHKTRDGGVTWTKISPDLTANEPVFRMRSGGPIDEDISGEEYYAVLYAIEESPAQRGVLWTGSNDGLFHVSKDGGATWTNVTPTMPSGGRVSKIEASVHQAGKAYYAVYRDYLGDDRPYIYITDDFGQSWNLSVKGIQPDHPVRVVREDPIRKGLLFAGTEFGLYISFDDGRGWQPFQTNLPIVPITDMQLVGDDLALSTLGRSFWVMDDISVLRQLPLESPESMNLFQPREPRVGEVLDLYFALPNASQLDSVQFEFRKGDTAIHSKIEKLKDLPKYRTWGLFKTEWDLRHYLKDGDRDFQGPWISPGQYEVHMTYRDMKTKAIVSVKKAYQMDESATVPDYQEQERLALNLARNMVKLKKEVVRIEIALNESRKKDKEALRSRLNQVKKGPKRYDKPMLLDHVEYLYEMLTETPQKLGKDAVDRAKTLDSMVNDFFNK